MRYLLLTLLVAGLIVLLLHSLKTSKEVATASRPNPMLKAKTVALQAQLDTVASALSQYYTDQNSYPEKLQDLIPRYLAGENDLIDPWGNRLQLRRESEESVFLLSAGPDRQFGTSDDIQRSL